jgi:hypothetical protein
LNRLVQIATAISLALAAQSGLAQDSPDAVDTEASKPRLIVAISIDQFSADLFAEYRGHYVGGLKRLAEGVVFPSAYQSHATTETCPGHSTILTGSRPARTGIIANTWFDLGTARDDKEIYCAEDESVPGSTSDNYTVSPVHLRVPALGDHMKRADSRSRVAVVAGKDRAAAMMGGFHPDQRWFWTGQGFSSTAQLGAAAVSVTGVNAAVAQSLSRPRPALDLPAVCAAKARPVAVVGSDRSVGDGRFERAAGETSKFRASPELDAATLELGSRLRDELRLGEGEATDLLILGLSASDYVGHSYGTQGSEMCLQVLALDRALGAFFAGLDARGIDYLAMLTADHGGHDIPERSRDHAIPTAVRVDPALAAGTMGKTVGESLGLTGPVLFGDGALGDMYVDRTLPDEQRSLALAEAVRRYRAHPQVAAVFTRADIAAAAEPSGPPDQWSLGQKVKASFDPERSGDFVVLLRPWVTPVYDTSRGYVAAHSSPWSYDQRVPLLFWRKGMRPFEQPLAVETVDILPTLAATIALPIKPESIDGRCLDLIDGPQSSCRPAD